jgi:hypothetical protein
MSAKIMLDTSIERRHWRGRFKVVVEKWRKVLTCSLYRPFLALLLREGLPAQSHGFFGPVLDRLCMGDICVVF